MSPEQLLDHGLPHEEVAQAAYFIWERAERPAGQENRHWEMAIRQLLKERLLTCLTALGHLTTQGNVGVWGGIRLLRRAAELLTDQALTDSLQQRPPVGRDQAADNKVVAPLSDAINRAIANADFTLAATIFRENYAKVLAYEATQGCEVHKGALAFDVGRAYLQGWDFFAAMHYFELAQLETQKTTSDPLFSVYSFDLFEKNFWDAVQVNTAAHPIPIYQALWGKPYDKQAALEDYGQLSQDSKLAYIIASAERVRLQNIADHSGWDGSDALRLGYWSLAADLARLLEVEAKRRFKTASGAGPQDTLLACLEQGFHNTAFGDISKEVQVEIPKVFPRSDRTGVKDVKTLYEDSFDGLLAVIRDPKKSPAARLSHALYLLGFTRNQVAHRLDKTSKLFSQLADAKDLVDLFLALCRTDEWKGI